MPKEQDPGTLIDDGAAFVLAIPPTSNGFFYAAARAPDGVLGVGNRNGPLRLQGAESEILSMPADDSPRVHALAALSVGRGLVSNVDERAALCVVERSGTLAACGRDDRLRSRYAHESLVEPSDPTTAGLLAEGAAIWRSVRGASP